MSKIFKYVLKTLHIEKTFYEDDRWYLMLERNNGYYTWKFFKICSLLNISYGEYMGKAIGLDAKYEPYDNFAFKSEEAANEMIEIIEAEVLINKLMNDNL